MGKLLLGVLCESFVAVSLAGIVLAVAIPALERWSEEGGHRLTPTIVIVGVLVAALALAIFRPGSALRRYFKQ